MCIDMGSICKHPHGRLHFWIDEKLGVPTAVAHAMKYQHEHILAHHVALPKIVSICSIVGKVVHVEHGMTIHPLSALPFLSPTPRTSMLWPLLVLGAMHSLKTSED
jgi:hypothetical protein